LRFDEAGDKPTSDAEMASHSAPPATNCNAELRLESAILPSIQPLQATAVCYPVGHLARG